MLVGYLVLGHYCYQKYFQIKLEDQPNYFSLRCVVDYTCDQPLQLQLVVSRRGQLRHQAYCDEVFLLEAVRDQLHPAVAASNCICPYLRCLSDMKLILEKMKSRGEGRE